MLTLILSKHLQPRSFERPHFCCVATQPPHQSYNGTRRVHVFFLRVDYPEISRCKMKPATALTTLTTLRPPLPLTVVQEQMLSIPPKGRDCVYARSLGALPRYSFTPAKVSGVWRLKLTAALASQ